jgi:hypothetical protein
MNKARSTRGPLQRGEVRSSLSKSGNAEMIVFTSATQFYYQDRMKLQVSRETAIRWAEDILIAYNVPFCNRVKGEQS